MTTRQSSKTLSTLVSGKLRKFFYNLGYFIALNPWRTILISCLLVVICWMGAFNFTSEKNAVKLWIPQDSAFLRDTNWFIDTYQQMYRVQHVLITAPDVLEPKVLQKVYHINEEISKFKTTLQNGSDISWNDICFKIPFISSSLIERKKRDITFTTKRPRIYNPSVDVFSIFYCPIVEMLPLGCLQPNLLELWKFDKGRIAELSKEDILLAINNITISPMTGHDTNFEHLLGGIKRNSSGHIIAASSLLSQWMLYVNVSDADKLGNDAGTEEWASEETLAWEAAFLNEMNRLQKIFFSKNEFEIFYSAGRSYGDISSSTMFQDMDKLFIGAILMFLYVQIVLSKFTWTEVRLILGTVGLMSIGMAFIAAIGICAAIGIFYGPVHTSLPFLLMGLGVDDLFVIMACWRQIDSKHYDRSVAERLGLTLQHAGSSITVTSITDVVAFLVASTTALPSLKSFCIHCAVGILVTYFLAVTFVVAVFSLDQRRIDSNRNGCLPCIVHKESPRKFELNFTQRLIKEIYSKWIFTKCGKILVILLAFVFLGIGIQGFIKLDQKFDPMWLVPESTYLYEYQTKQRTFYPDMGYEGKVFLGNLNYTKEMPKIIQLVDEMENKTKIIHNVIAWPKPFNDFVEMYYYKDLRQDILTDDDWRLYLSKFLFSSNGGRFQPMFKFDKELKCGKPTGNVMASMLDFRYQIFNERNEYVPAMHSMDNLVTSLNFDGFAAVWAKIYGEWITNEVVDHELLRNISLALVCVMACTSIFIANLRTCFFIFVSVFLTLINVAGFLQWWGQTIDLISCVGLQLAVGLCVDYAAHIGHTFLSTKNGTKHERALETVLHIGAAVFYGGISTLLALVVLANSDAYTFKSFFKIFLLMIFFGLFNGVVLLPIVLSLIGPEGEKSTTKEDEIIKTDGAEMISFIGPKTEHNVEAKDNEIQDKSTLNSTSKQDNDNSA